MFHVKHCLNNAPVGGAIMAEVASGIILIITRYSGRGLGYPLDIVIMIMI